MQIFGITWLWGYCILSALQLLPYFCAARQLRTLNSPETTAAKKALDGATCCYYIVMAASYVCLLAFLVDVLGQIRGAAQYVADAAGVTLEPNAAEILTSIVDIDTLLTGLFEFYTTYYVGVAAWVDILSYLLYLVLLLHRTDGAYHPKGADAHTQHSEAEGAFAGITSIVAMENGAGQYDKGATATSQVDGSRRSEESTGNRKNLQTDVQE